jgi:hypothetical protein
MSQAKFEKAVEIVQGLPKDGPIQPSMVEKLLVWFTRSAKKKTPFIKISHSSTSISSRVCQNLARHECD